MEVKFSQADRMITAYIKAKLVPMLAGSPGCGKSQLIYQIAERYNLKVIDLRLSQCDPTDLAGFPTIEGNKADYVPMKHFPVEGDKIPEGYSGWLLFLDEITSAMPDIQAAAYKLVLDRMVGSHHLHKNVAIACAGNKETDNAVAHAMSTALQSRLVHLELVVDWEEWCNWAADEGMDHRISDFIKFKPSMLYTFSPDHSDNTYACPRTWEFTNRLLKETEVTATDALPLLAGTLSEGVAREFVTFCKIYKDLPSMKEIITNPDKITVPQEPSVLFALTGAMAQNATETNLADLLKFINRLPSEFQVLCLKETIRRNKALLSVPALQDWIAKSGKAFF